MGRKRALLGIFILYQVFIILGGLCVNAQAQTLPPTEVWTASSPPKVWELGVEASRAQYEQVKNSTGSPIPAAEAVSIIRLIGQDVVPFTPERQQIAFLAFQDVMPPGGLLEFHTFKEGAPDFNNPDTVSYSEPYMDVAAILWQLSPTDTNGAPVSWGTQSQAVLLWGGALVKRGLNVTVKVMALNVAASKLPKKVLLHPLVVVDVLLEFEVDGSGQNTAQPVALNLNQTWAVNQAQEYMKDWAGTHTEIKESDQEVLKQRYPEAAAALQPNRALIEVETAFYACSGNSTTNSTQETTKIPENCELQVAEMVFDAFMKDSAASLAAVGLRNGQVVSTSYRQPPPDALNPPSKPDSSSSGSSSPTKVSLDNWVPWHLDLLDQRNLPLDGKFTSTADGTGVNVYVISSGIRADHSEFKIKGTDESKVQGLWGFNGIDPKTDCADGSLWYSFGTYAASLIAGNTVGVARNATLHSVRMRETCLLDSRSIWSPGALPSALDAVLSTFQRPGIIAIDTWWSPSRIADDNDTYIQEEISWRLKKAAELDVPIITANGVGISTSTPCDNIFTQGESVIRVGGVDSTLHSSITGSVNSPCLDLWGPGGGLTAGITGASAEGVDEFTTVVPRGFGAAWLVAGIAAQYLQFHPNASVPELRAALMSMASVNKVEEAGPNSPNLLAFTDLMRSDGNAASAESGSGGGISAGAIVGIVIGVLAVGAVAAAVFVSMKKRKSRGQDVDKLDSPMLEKRNSSGLTVLFNSPRDSMNFPIKSNQIHDWEISEDQIEFVPGPDGTEYWVVGKGKYGEVRRALKDGIQAVAVKTLRRDTETLGELPHDAFAREIAMMQWLSRDANVVQFFGACVKPGTMMLVTELMEGGDLRTALKNPQTSKLWGWYGKGKGVALDIARGMHFLHSHGVVHRDIKSKNILLGRDGRAKLGDVGLAYISFNKSVEQDSKHHEREEDDGFVGTYAFSAPEMILCGTATPKADMYSFGVVLWEICTGKVAVRGHLRAPRVPEDCPQDVSDVMMSCLSADPDERPTAREAYESLLPCPPLQGQDYEEQAALAASANAHRIESASLQSLQSESLPSISLSSGNGAVNAQHTPKTRAEDSIPEDLTMDGPSSAGSSSLVAALGALTPGLKSVVHQIRRRLQGDGQAQVESKSNSPGNLPGRQQPGSGSQNGRGGQSDTAVASAV